VEPRAASRIVSFCPLRVPPVLRSGLPDLLETFRGPRAGTQSSVDPAVPLPMASASSFRSVSARLLREP
jgi:hypothetical protein